MKKITTDLCVIGAGSGGLSIAAVAAQLGVKVVLIEKNKMGGDCLNYGCVPSKALLAAARSVKSMTHAKKFGVNVEKYQVDFKAVHDHVQGVIDSIAPNDSVERFEGLGVHVILAEGSFVDNNTVQAGNQTITAKRFVIASGSTAAVPPIPGLRDVDYLTNENIFDLETLPEKLLVIGGGPIGCEMAQAHALLGSNVSVFEMATIFPKDDVECVAVVREELINDGVSLFEGVSVVSVKKSEQGVRVHYEKDGKEHHVDGTHILVATGRRPNIDGLELTKAGVEFTPRGIEVNKRLRTSNKRIYAVGDITGGFQFTHTASYHAGIIVRNLLFRLPAKVDYAAMPWVTFTMPELAHVGMIQADAEKKGLTVNVTRFEFSENDRAQTERDTKGMIKVVTNLKGKILGATIVGDHAGELILPWALAINERLNIKALTSVIAPYPTLSEISKRVAGEYYRASLFSEKTKRLIRWLF